MSIDGPKKSRGRPPVESEAVKVRLPQALLNLLDAHRGDETRQEAIRKLLALALESEEWSGKGLSPVILPLTTLERRALERWAAGQPDSPSPSAAALRLFQAALQEADVHGPD